jgi:gp6-like head-tail connector protein
MADQLCTTAQVKLRIFPAGVTDTSDDALISELIDQVSDYIQQYTGRRLVPISSTTYVFDTVSGYVLRIPIGVRTISALGVNNLLHQPDTGGSYTTVTAADYLLRPKVQDSPPGWPFTEVWLSRGTLTGTVGSFGTVTNGCTITGTFGFAATPPDIQGVAMDATIAAYQARKLGTSGVIGADEGSLTPWNDFFSVGSPQRATLNRYRYMGLA